MMSGIITPHLVHSKDHDMWYYLESKEGAMLVGLNQVDGKQYYFSASGAMQTGWKWFDNHYRYFESNGAMKTGWIKDKGVWYYLNPEDNFLHNTEKIFSRYHNQSGRYTSSDFRSNWFHKLQNYTKDNLSFFHND